MARAAEAKRGNHERMRSSGRYLRAVSPLVTMCIGSGQGIAAIVERM
jgi:hypothetical protein